MSLKIAGKVSWCRQTLSKAEVIKDTISLHVLKSTDPIHLYEIFDQLQTLKNKNFTKNNLLMGSLQNGLRWSLNHKFNKSRY